MSPFIDVVVFILAFLFVILSLIPLLANPPEGTGLDGIQLQAELSDMPVQNLIDMHE